MWGALGNAAGGLAGGWMLSDRRAKTDIRKVADVPVKPTVGLYRYRYKGSPFQRPHRSRPFALGYPSIIESQGWS